MTFHTVEYPVDDASVASIAKYIEARKINIVGQSPAVINAIRLANIAADYDVPVLIQAETGCGKELFSQLIHQQSSRARAPFIAVNCAVLPNNLIESELFGVVKGAYTGADQSRAGRFERAKGGTLFLDEVGELPESAQAKLLRVLQSGEYDRVGDISTCKADVRIIAATNVDLEERVKLGKFRADLLYRLNVYPLDIPPMRDHLEDIPDLTTHFISKYNEKHGKSVTGFSGEILDYLMSYKWPGNIRELENIIERAVILTADGAPIAPRDIAIVIKTAESSTCFSLNSVAPDNCLLNEDFFDTFLQNKLSLEDVESNLLKLALKRSEGNISAAARLLKLGDAQLRYRLKKFDICS